MQFAQANAKKQKPKIAKELAFLPDKKLYSPLKKQKYNARNQENIALKDGQPVTSVLQDSG